MDKTTVIGDIRSTQYAQLASSVVILFDHLVTLDGEIELIWRSSWSAGKALFILNRYYTFFSVIFNNYAIFTPNLTDSFCTAFFRWQGWTGLIACIIAEVMLQMRIYALYHLNKRVLVFMGASFVISTATAASILGTSLSMIRGVSEPLQGVHFCVPIHVPGYFFTFWIPMLVFETLLCGLALFRGFQAFKADGPLFQSGKHLVGILIRDSVLYFLAIFAAYFTNFLVWVTAPTALFEIPVCFTVAMSCVMANRLVLNVREVNRDLGLSKPATRRATHSSARATRGTSVFDRPQVDTLTDIEMKWLRTMRAQGETAI